MRYIHPKAIKVWRIHGMIWTFICLIAAVALFICGRLVYHWFYYGGGVMLLLAIGSGILSIWLIPVLRWRFFRYRISETQVMIREGIWMVKQTVIPIARIQYVDTHQGPLLRRYRLSSLKVSTAATTHHIPALGHRQAISLRNYLADLAQVSDVDV
ncbi:membrane protein [Pullulanibacillus camelliae]|uniref:Membrane protein n=1 Tax=Pullulanibacillus camelliae TaxID=1707096 RepID=A0A8J2VNH2_9BACL|nr:PH domain-containing protein [Pullulanibacillus camelliae]GGE33930.1 membrane protein [Pullulanibacillus camelliae]